MGFMLGLVVDVMVGLMVGVIVGLMVVLGVGPYGGCNRWHCGGP